MNIKFHIVFVALLVCSTNCNSNNTKSLDEFYIFFGAEKAEILKLTLASFDEFILKNYSHLKSEEGQIKAFLMDFDLEKNTDKIISKGKKWITNKELNNELVKRFEESGLLKEIYISRGELKNYKAKYNIESLMPDDFGKPNFQTPETDNNRIIPNNKGEFLYALYKFSNNEALKRSMSICYFVEDISPTVTLSIFTRDGDIFNLNDPFIKFWIIREVYLKLMQQNR